MEHVVIIGCGYLGSHLANYFHEKAWSVTIIGRDSEYSHLLSEGIRFVGANINDMEELQKYIKQDDIVLYAAGSINATNMFSDVLADIESYYTSFVKLIEFCSYVKVKKFVFLSSAGTVYGNTLARAKEDDSMNPINIYGLQKVFFENLIKIKHNETNNLPYLILRVTNPYGGFQNPNKKQGIIPVLINKALNKEEFIFWGNIQAVRDFIFIDDFLEATFRAIKLVDQEILNIGSGVGTSISQVISIVEQRTNQKINIVYKNTGQTTIMKNVVNTDKLNSLTGYYPSTTLEDGIASIIKGNKKET
ncbi:NAD-dependent epimerase/dehydratase family protein [Paenibacillus terrae]